MLFWLSIAACKQDPLFEYGSCNKGKMVNAQKQKTKRRMNIDWSSKKIFDTKWVISNNQRRTEYIVKFIVHLISFKLYKGSLN